MSTPFVVAVDGPSGSGKSSTARGVATRLSLAYLDTGAMYRAVTWALLQRGTDLGDPAAIARDAVDLRLESGTDPQSPTIAVDGADVSEAVRDDDVNAHVSPVAAVPEVRSMLVDQQRAIIAEATGGIVVEGRDIGSTVAPDAPVKVFLVADAQARAARHLRHADPPGTRRRTGRPRAHRPPCAGRRRRAPPAAPGSGRRGAGPGRCDPRRPPA